MNRFMRNVTATLITLMIGIGFCFYEISQLKSHNKILFESAIKAQISIIEMKEEIIVLYKIESAKKIIN